MTDEEKRRAIGSLVCALPDALTAMQIARTLHQSKNRIYEKMKNGELPYYPVNGKCLIAKADLIEYILRMDSGNGLKRPGATCRTY